MRLIIGLGNPGKEYVGTRHNIGFVLVDKAISNFQFPISNLNRKLRSELSEGISNGNKIIFAKPQTFMNNSGPEVAKILRYHKIKPSDMLVIHDDKDILLGEFKIQTNRGAAGHNGVQSIIDSLGTKNFTRVRVGIAPADKEIRDTSDFVLKKFSKKEKEILETVVEAALKEVEKIL